MGRLGSFMDRARAGAFGAIEHAPGKVGAALRKANEVLGRPLADADEIADRRAFASHTPRAAVAAAAAAPAQKTAAPVIVYYMDKTRRDAQKLVEVLEANGIPHTITNIQEDTAAQFAVRRDAKRARLPVVFVAGECLGGREQLVNLAASGEMKRKVFG